MILTGGCSRVMVLPIWSVNDDMDARYGSKEEEGGLGGDGAEGSDGVGAAARRGLR